MKNAIRVSALLSLMAAGCGPHVWIAGAEYPIDEVCANRYCDISGQQYVANPKLWRVIGEGKDILGRTGKLEAMMSNPSDQAQMHKCRDLAPSDYSDVGLSVGTVSSEIQRKVKATLAAEAFGIGDGKAKADFESRISGTGAFSVHRYELTEAAIKSLEGCRKENGGYIVTKAAIVTSDGTFLDTEFTSLQASAKAAVESTGGQAQLSAQVQQTTKETVKAKFLSTSYAIVWGYVGP